MTIEETTLSFLKQDCIQEFGEKRGEEIYNHTQTFYAQLLENSDDRGSKAILEHLQKKLFPPMAYYKALLADGISQQEALTYVKKETQKSASIKKQEMERLAKIPLAYTVYRLGVKKFMKKNFPDEGWQTEWVQCDGKEIHFNLHKCIYWDLTKSHGCPELCCVYCENDNISFSGLLPKIRFKRTGTLGEGASFCDFHFIKV
ncbi:L-2-amino-thiazoline-4-carboxylic acid hydrolase [[Clostridium] leptum]|nr:L-2-amino-thiazoline-4-carboxylic acid hydrolase [[Clostridium] leptum]